MYGHNNNPQRSSTLSCMGKLLLISGIVVMGIFWLIGGQEWLTLALIPAPEARLYDEILGPPDNPGWRRTMGVTMRADVVNDYFLQALGEQGWKIEPKASSSSVGVDYCLKGEHVLFPTIYIEIISQKSGKKILDESSIFIRTNPELSPCHRQP